jgi:hypothetical protein
MSRFQSVSVQASHNNAPKKEVAEEFTEWDDFAESMEESPQVVAAKSAGITTEASSAPFEPIDIIQRYIYKYNNQSNPVLAKNPQEAKKSDVYPPNSFVRLADPVYRLEKKDPKHRMGQILYPLFVYYGKMPKISETIGFFKWVDEQTEDQILGIVRNYTASDGNKITISPTMEQAIRNHFKNGLTYLKEMEARTAYRITVVGGDLHREDKVFDTTGLGNGTNDPDNAMWVMMPIAGEDGCKPFYSHKGTYLQFHHTSFLGGKKVGGVGEWQVKSGKLQSITGKSGHYQPPHEAIQRALIELKKQKANLDKAKVVVLNETKDPNRFKAEQYLSEFDQIKNNFTVA